MRSWIAGVLLAAAGLRTRSRVPTLGPYLAARAGSARWQLESENRRSDSDLKMQLDALTVGLDFYF